MQITTKFSVGDRAYFALYATAVVHAVDVKRVYLRSNEVVYDVIRADNGFILAGVKESEIGSFTEARALMIGYLEAKLLEINSAVAP